MTFYDRLFIIFELRLKRSVQFWYFLSSQTISFHKPIIKIRLMTELRETLDSIPKHNTTEGVINVGVQM